MLIARVRATATDEGRETLIETLSAEAGRIPTMFEGCELYVVSVDTADPNTVIIAEEWQSRELFEAYQTSEHFSGIMAVAALCLAAPPDSAYYDGDRVGP